MSIILTNKHIGSDGKRIVAKSLGTWVRISGPPKMLIIIFLQIFQWISRYEDHHAPQESTCQMAFRPNLVVMNEGSPWSQVNARIANHKGQTGWTPMGLKNCQIHTLFRPTPPWVFLYILFLFSYLFILSLLLLLKIN